MSARFTPQKTRCILHNAHFGDHLFINTTSTVNLLGDCLATKPAPCPVCAGRGGSFTDSEVFIRCTYCHGKGTVRIEVTK